MAIESPCFSIGFLEAAADLSAKQFTGVYVVGGKVNTTAAKGGIFLGILQNKPLAGEVADVMVLGVSKLLAGTGDLAADAQYEFDTDGTGVTAEAGKVAGGVVLTAATATKLASVTVGFGAADVIHA
jgi:hypothetical protein